MKYELTSTRYKIIRHEYEATIGRYAGDNHYEVGSMTGLRNFSQAGLIEYIDFLKEVEHELKVLNGQSGND